MADMFVSNMQGSDEAGDGVRAFGSALLLRGRSGGLGAGGGQRDPGAHTVSRRRWRRADLHRHCTSPSPDLSVSTCSSLPELGRPRGYVMVGFNGQVKKKK